MCSVKTERNVTKTSDLSLILLLVNTAKTKNMNKKLSMCGSNQCKV